MLVLNYKSALHSEILIKGNNFHVTIYISVMINQNNSNFNANADPPIVTSKLKDLNI